MPQHGPREGFAGGHVPGYPEPSRFRLVAGMTMSRRVLVVLVAVGFLGAPAAAAQTPGRVVRIGILSTATPRSAAPWQTFERRLRELGYIEGRNLALEFRTGAEVRIGCATLRPSWSS